MVIQINWFLWGTPCKGGNECCSEHHPCGLNEGGCTADNQCQPGMHCGFKSVEIGSNVTVINKIITSELMLQHVPKNEK